MMDQYKKVLEEGLKTYPLNISETMIEMRVDMKEDRRVRQEQAKQLTEHVVILRQFKEELNMLRA